MSRGLRAQNRESKRTEEEEKAELRAARIGAAAAKIRITELEVKLKASQSGAAAAEITIGKLQAARTEEIAVCDGLCKRLNVLHEAFYTKQNPAKLQDTHALVQEVLRFRNNEAALDASLFEAYGAKVDTATPQLSVVQQLRSEVQQLRFEAMTSEKNAKHAEALIANLREMIQTRIKKDAAYVKNKLMAKAYAKEQYAQKQCLKCKKCKANAIPSNYGFCAIHRQRGS
jgi:hypothetical protein